MYLTFYGSRKAVQPRRSEVFSTSRLDTRGPWPTRVQRAGEPRVPRLDRRGRTARPRSLHAFAATRRQGGGCARLQLDAGRSTSCSSSCSRSWACPPRELAGPSDCSPSDASFSTVDARPEHSAHSRRSAEPRTRRPSKRSACLSNLETPTEKLCRSCWWAQPELWAKLDRPELRQLWSGSSCGAAFPVVRATRSATSHDPARVAGSRTLGLFSDGRTTGLRLLAGNPRRVTFCASTACHGYADQRRRIDVDIVDQAIESLQGAARRPARRPALLARTTRARCSWARAPARCSPDRPWRRCVSKPRISSRSRATCATCSCDEQILRSARASRDRRGGPDDGVLAPPHGPTCPRRRTRAPSVEGAAGRATTASRGRSPSTVEATRRGRSARRASRRAS